MAGGGSDAGYIAGHILRRGASAAKNGRRTGIPGSKYKNIFIVSLPPELTILLWYVQGQKYLGA